MPSTRSSARSSSANDEALVARQVAAVGVDVLARAASARRTPSAARRSASASTSAVRRERSRPRTDGHDAVGADGVAAHRDLQPGLERPGAAQRQVGGEAVEGAEPAAAARAAASWPRRRRGGRRCRGRTRSRRTGTRRTAGRPSTPTSSRRPRRPWTGSRSFSARAFIRCACRRLSAFSRMVQVLNTSRSASAGRRGLAQAGGLEQAADALRVVLVHLAAEGGDVVAAHRPKPTWRTRTPATPGSRSP